LIRNTFLAVLAACAVAVAMPLAAQAPKSPVAPAVPGPAVPATTSPAPPKGTIVPSPATNAATVPAAPKPPDAASIRAAGRKAAEFCGNCHGDDGNSKQSDVPNLAGQNRVYLRSQMQKFASGERKNKFKEGLMKLLPQQDLPLIATYYAESAVVPPVARPGPEAARGRELYAQRCTQCHGAEGLGREDMARLAGQQVEYMQVSLKRFRDRTGERTHGPAVAGATNGDIDALANYLGSMR
jgi:cytochrome c553